METAVSGRTWDFQIVILKSAVPKQDVEKTSFPLPQCLITQNPTENFPILTTKHFIFHLKRLHGPDEDQKKTS